MTQEELKVGLILRTYAGKEEDIPKRADMVASAIEATRKAKVNGIPVIRRIDILIPTDKRYKDADCGKTATYLSERFNAGNGVFVTEVPFGDRFCQVLNRGLAIQQQNGCNFSMIASPEAFSYMNPEVMTEMVEAVPKGALAIGVAINELTQSVMEGRLANTFAMWHIESLIQVGGFDLRAAVPVDEKFTVWIDDGTGKLIVAQGVEEVIPLARMSEAFGPCIAPIMPRGEGIQKYEVPDEKTHLEAYAKHMQKMGTKSPRQKHFLSLVGYDFDLLSHGVMPEYRIS